MTSEIDKLSYGLLCNIVVLKVVKDEEMRNNK